jgi:ABC-2 type transport system permease protein
VHTAPSNWPLYFLVICLVSILFSALGVIFGLTAEKFDHIAILTTFVITPLTFVGGVFTDAKMLPPPLRTFELFNPIFYTIDAFRRSYTGQSYLPPALSVAAIALLAAVSLGIALRMMATGYKLRT